MNAIKERERIFSELHAEILKPRGYKKFGAWSIKHQSDFTLAIHLRSSRWSQDLSTDFWIDLNAYHQNWHQLYTGSPLPAKPKEETTPLIQEILGELEGPQHRCISINEKTDLGGIKKIISERLTKQLTSFENKCHTLRDALKYLENNKYWPRGALHAAGIALLLKEEARAEMYIHLAKKSLPHEKSQEFIESKRAFLWEKIKVLNRN